MSIQDLKRIITVQQGRIEELENILKDFLTTKEDHRTWVDEMHGTIDAVLSESKTVEQLLVEAKNVQD